VKKKSEKNSRETEMVSPPSVWLLPRAPNKEGLEEDIMEMLMSRPSQLLYIKSRIYFKIKTIFRSSENRSFFWAPRNFD
jgi:hypothetical protein